MTSRLRSRMSRLIRGSLSCAAVVVAGPLGCATEAGGEGVSSVPLAQKTSRKLYTPTTSRTARSTAMIATSFLFSAPIFIVSGSLIFVGQWLSVLQERSERYLQRHVAAFLSGQ